MIERVGLTLQRSEDRTPNMAEMAGRWRDAREARSERLRAIEGDEVFEGQQEFLALASSLASERRLSRFAFKCTKSP